MNPSNNQRPTITAHIFGLMTMVFLCFGLATAATAQTIKIATIAPEGSAWMNDMRAGAKEIDERTEGRGTNEVLSSVGHDRHDMCTRIDEATCHLNCLVRGDAPGHTEDDALSGER